MSSQVYAGGAQDAPRRSKTLQDDPRWPKTPPRRPQDAPKTLPRRPKTPHGGSKTAPRRPQDASRTPQDASRSGKLGDRFGMETRFPAESPPDLDFGASWARFWEVLGSISTAFAINWRSAGDLLRSKIVLRTFQVRASKKSGASRSMSNQVFLRAKTVPRRLQDAPRCAQDAPKAFQEASMTRFWWILEAKMEPS